MSYRLLCSCFALSLALTSAAVGQEARPIRVGIIGLDTSHVVAFTKLLNDPKASGDLEGVQVVAAYPGGSPDIPSSADRLEGFTKSVRDMDVEIVDSIDQLLTKVDAVLLVTDHSRFPYDLIHRSAALIVDSRNAFRARGLTGAHVVSA